MKDRLKQLMDDQHLTQQSFAQKLKISAATLCNIFNGKTNPSLSIIDGIHKSFPQVNVYWVLYGSPPMYLDQAQGQASDDGLAAGMQIVAGASGGSTFGAGGSVADAATGAGAAQGRLVEGTMDFGASGASGSLASPSLFDPVQMRGVNNTPKNMAHAEVKFIDKPQRKITEIRIFYDDQTWETFVPKK